MKINTQSFRARKMSLFTAVLLVALAVSLVTAVLQTQVRAATGSIYLTPANATVVVNNTVTVNLRINPGTAVTVVEATVGFDPAKLQYVSANTSSSPFDTNVKQTTGGSSLQFSRAKLDAGGISSDSLIASITFRALTANGLSSLGISGANAAFNGAYTNPGMSGATITFSPGSCPAGQTGTPPNCRPATVSPKPSSTPSTKQATPKPSGMTAPKPNTPTESKPQDSKTAEVSTVVKPKITRQDVAYTKVVIDATTEEPGRVLVRYGTSRDALNTQTPLSTSGKNHTITLDKGLTPGMKLYYVVVNQNAEGAVSQTDVQTISTKGMAVKLALLGADLTPLRNQDVRVEPLGISAKSDGDGYVKFDSLPPGDFTVTVTVGGTKYSEHLNVVSNVETVNGVQSSKEQSKAIVYSGLAAGSNSSVLYAVIAVAAVIAAGIIALAVLRPRVIKSMAHRLPFARESAPTTTVTPGVFEGKDPTVTPSESFTPRPIGIDTTLRPNLDPYTEINHPSSLPHSSLVDKERRL